jgi:hypothetical protein
MFEFVQLTAQNPELELDAVTVAYWFGAGLVVGLLVALASVSALAIECLRREQYHL